MLLGWYNCMWSCIWAVYNIAQSKLHCCTRWHWSVFCKLLIVSLCLNFCATLPLSTSDISQAQCTVHLSTYGSLNWHALLIADKIPKAVNSFVRFLYRKNREGILAKIDDDMLRHYCNEDVFLMQVPYIPIIRSSVGRFSRMKVNTSHVYISSFDFRSRKSPKGFIK